MKTKPATNRITFSTLVMALKYIPNFSILNAITKANRITGNPVPNENTIGKAKPTSAESVIGISIAKNNAPLYGQNANANNAPNKKVPNNLSSVNVLLSDR
jgi:hypothetical protein